MAVFPVNPGGPSLPLEGSPYPAVPAWREAVGAARNDTFGATMLATWTNGGGQIIPQKDAEAQLKAQNYDSTGVPAEGMTQGALLERMNRASADRQSQDDMRRAGAGFLSRTSASLVGGLGDPLNVVLAPLSGFGAGAVRAGMAGRVLLGGLEGGTISAATTVAQNKFDQAHGLGDPDLTSLDLMRTTLTGAAFGGIMNGAFGPRPVSPRVGGSLTLDMIDRFGEKTASYAKAHGISPDDAISPKGAVGMHQIEPSTARLYGLKGTDAEVIAQLRDRATNDRIGQRIVDDLNKRYPNDPEAAAIAYNAGPKYADRFIRAGRDYSVLPKETRDYAARIVGVTPQVRTAAAQTALSQVANDSVVDVNPTIEQGMADEFKTNPFRIQDEHDDEVMRLETEAYQNSVPQPDSLFTRDPDIQQMLRLIDAKPIEPPIEESTGSRSPVTTAENVSNTEPGFVSKPAIDPELSQHLAADVKDAKSLQSVLGDEKMVYEEPEPMTIDGMNADEHQKAVEAAVRCGLIKGGF